MCLSRVTDLNCVSGQWCVCYRWVIWTMSVVSDLNNVFVTGEWFETICMLVASDLNNSSVCQWYVIWKCVSVVSDLNNVCWWVIWRICVCGEFFIWTMCVSGEWFEQYVCQWWAIWILSLMSDLDNLYVSDDWFEQYVCQWWAIWTICVSVVSDLNNICRWWIIWYLISVLLAVPAESDTLYGCDENQPVGTVCGCDENQAVGTV